MLTDSLFVHDPDSISESCGFAAWRPPSYAYDKWRKDMLVLYSNIVNTKIVRNASNIIEKRIKKDCNRSNMITMKGVYVNDAKLI